ncbi:MAG TPA: ABC transporter ATP-binding protein [Anaerolineae bacterium]
MASIRLENLRKEFGQVVAVEGLSLEIADGEFAALLGPSGCGKTTTMNMISGLETPTSGTIYFDGKPVNSVPPGMRGIGFVFQNYAIFTHMTVYENIAFGLKIRGCPDAEQRREVRKVAELLQIDDQLQVNAGRLSVNDMQKVALGRSMITDPRIFLLDEPFSNLDASFRAYMRAELKRIQREVRQTMIYVTHDQIEAMSMADKIAVMYCGQLYQWGTPDQVYNHPVNAFVARFIGSPNMNFIACRLVVEGGQAWLVQKSGTARVALDDRRRQLLSANPGSEDLILGIRPEHMHVHAQSPGGEAAWQGTVYAIEPLGPKTIVHIRVGSDVVQVIAAPSYRPRVGDPHWVVLNPAFMHVFAGDSKQVIR